MTDTAEPPFAEWCVLELMGHRRLAGYVTSCEIAGKGFLRLDVPGEGSAGFAATQFYSPASVYAITPIAEDVARSVAKRHQPEPVYRWELPAADVVDAAEAVLEIAECHTCGDHLESDEIDRGECANCWHR